MLGGIASVDTVRYKEYLLCLAICDTSSSIWCAELHQRLDSTHALTQIGCSLLLINLSKSWVSKRRKSY
jgi:hypothetical protein